MRVRFTDQEGSDDAAPGSAPGFPAPFGPAAVDGLVVVPGSAPVGVRRIRVGKLVHQDRAAAGAAQSATAQLGDTGARTFGRSGQQTRGGWRLRQGSNLRPAA